MKYEKKEFKEWLKRIDGLVLETKIDELGEIQAIIAGLEKKEDALKDAIKKETGGVGAYEGDLFRAVLVSGEREVFDGKRARERLIKLGLGRFVKRLISYTSYTSITLYSKSGKDLAA